MFKKAFYASSFQKLKEVKYLALMAIFIAMKIVISSMYFPLGENLRIGFSFVVVAVESAIIGPIGALVSGAITDNLGFFLNPTGIYFFGYTITAMVGGFVYALFFYEQKITVSKIIVAKAINSFFTNVTLGSLWSHMMFSKGYVFYFLRSLTKNTLLFPIEVFFLVILLNILIPILVHRQLIQTKQPKPIPWF